MKVWHFGSQTLGSITSLLAKPDTTVEAVLDDPGLNAAMRNNLNSLITFLIDNEEKFTHLLDMVLTDFVPQTDLPAKTTRNAVNVLSSGSCSTIMQNLRGNPIFIERINSFPESGFGQNPRCCGHYERIIESFARASNGEFLQSIPCLKTFIAHNMSNLGLRELFITLASDYPTYFALDQQYLNELAQAANSDNGFYILTAIDTVSSNKKLKNVLDQISKVDFIRSVLTIAKNENNRPLVVTTAFNLIKNIIKKIRDAGYSDAPIREFLNKESETYPFESIENDAILGAALQILHTKSDKILLRILSDGQPTFVCDGIFESIKSMNQAELTDFLQRTDFINRLTEQFPKTKTNIHLSLLTAYLRDRVEKQESWESFLQSQYEPREKVRKMDYGGSRPNDYSDSDTTTQPTSDNDMIPTLSSDDSDDDDDSSDDPDDELLFDKNSSDDDSDSDDEHKSPADFGNCMKLHKFGSRQEAPQFHESSSSSDDDGQPVQMVAAPVLNFDLIQGDKAASSSELKPADDLLLPEPLQSDDDQYDDKSLSDSEEDDEEDDMSRILKDITRPLQGSGQSQSYSEDEEEEKKLEKLENEPEQKPEEPKPEEPKVEERKVEEPKPEEQKPEEPKVEEQKVEEPKVEEKAEEQKVEEQKVEEEKIAEKPAEKPKAEEKAEEQKAEEPKVEEKAEEPKEEVKAEEQKVEQPVADKPDESAPKEEKPAVDNVDNSVEQKVE